MHDSPPSHFAVRPLAPIEGIVDLNSCPTLHSIMSQHQGRDKRGQLLAVEALAHAKVYSFVHKYLMSELEELATCRLAQTLVILQHLKTNMLRHLADTTRLIYSTTPSDAQNPARRLLSQFVAAGLPVLSDGHLDVLLLQGGDFDVEVLHKVGRKIAELESRFSALESRFSALELEHSETREDLISSRESVSGWESWNSHLPSKWRRRDQNPDDDMPSASYE